MCTAQLIGWDPPPPPRKKNSFNELRCRSYTAQAKILWKYVTKTCQIRTLSFTVNHDLNKKVSLTMWTVNSDFCQGSKLWRNLRMRTKVRTCRQLWVYLCGLISGINILRKFILNKNTGFGTPQCFDPLVFLIRFIWFHCVNPMEGIIISGYFQL